jgi:hypothetical protein
MGKSRLILIVPHGYHGRIYPWGVNHIKDHFKNALPETEVLIWEMRKDAQIQEALRSFEPYAAEVASRLERIAPLMPSGWRTIPDPFTIIAGLLQHGLDTLQEGEPLPVHPCQGSAVKTLDEAVSEVKLLVKKQAASYLQAGDEGRTVFGFSVSDSTILEVMFVGRMLKEQAPGARIILGGNFFFPDSAAEFIRKVDWADAVVVGWGEGAAVTILRAVDSGESIDTVRLPGVYTRARSHEPPGEVGLAAPAAFADPRTSPISYVKVQDGEIRILLGHGCEWNRCTFCHIWAAFCHHPIGVSPVVDELRRTLSPGLLAAWKGRCLVSVDSVSTPALELVDMINVLFGEIMDPAFARRSTLFYWQRTAQVCRHAVKMAEALRFLLERGVLLRPSLGLETLSPGVLKTMRKGVTALHNLFALKLLRDLGKVTVANNYFVSYPLERLADVEVELEVLRRSMHLMTMPSVWQLWNSYQASPYDAIFARQEHYGVSVHGPDSNHWARTFGPELELSPNSRGYSLLSDESLYGEQERTWHAAVYSPEFEEMTFRLATEGGQAQGLSETWIGVLEDFARRHRIHPLYLERLRILLQPQIWWRNQWRTGENRAPEFHLEGRTLSRSYPQPWGESWDLALESDELEVLRLLYMPRTKEELAARLGSSPGAGRIDEILTRHLERGSLLCRGRRYLGLYNDPEGSQHLEDIVV